MYEDSRSSLVQLVACLLLGFKLLLEKMLTCRQLLVANYARGSGLQDNCKEFLSILIEITASVNIVRKLCGHVIVEPMESSCSQFNECWVVLDLVRRKPVDIRQVFEEQLTICCVLNYHAKHIQAASNNTRIFVRHKICEVWNHCSRLLWYFDSI